jgi:serine/threonine-protein kinase
MRRESGNTSRIAVEIALMLEAGKILGHYRIEDKIGEGAFGEVWRGVDIRLDRKVALKVMRAAVDEDAEAWGRLLEEARAASALNHPGICATYDVGEEDGLGYIAMEYVEGRPLSDLVRAGPLPAAPALAYGIEMAEALAHAHNRGIIHRDLKASNVMITSEDHPKLLDFGLARRLDAPAIESLTKSRQSLADLGGTAGTLCYMAPELLRGKPAGPQSDLWSFGALLYEMLSGKLPFQGQTPFELSMAIMIEETPVLDAGLPERLRSVVRQCLEKDPAKRPADAGEVRAALEQAKAALKTAGPGRATRRTRTWAAAAALAALLGLLGASFARRHQRKGHPTAPAGIAVVQTAPPRDQTAPGGVQTSTSSQSSQAGDAGQKQKPSAARGQKAGGRSQTTGNPNTEVWVNLKTGVYHCPGTRWYKKTASGRLIKQRQAQSAGYHAASNKPCE